MERIIDGYEIQVEEDAEENMTAIYKDGDKRGVYYGITDSNIALRLFVNAIRTMDDEQ